LQGLQPGRAYHSLVKLECAAQHVLLQQQQLPCNQSSKVYLLLLHKPSHLCAEKELMLQMAHLCKGHPNRHRKPGQKADAGAGSSSAAAAAGSSKAPAKKSGKKKK
jgi:hypothetical protein